MRKACGGDGCTDDGQRSTAHLRAGRRRLYAPDLTKRGGDAAIGSRTAETETATGGQTTSHRLPNRVAVLLRAKCEALLVATPLPCSASFAHAASAWAAQALVLRTPPDRKAGSTARLRRVARRVLLETAAWEKAQARATAPGPRKREQTGPGSGDTQEPKNPRQSISGCTRTGRTGRRGDVCRRAE